MGVNRRSFIKYASLAAAGNAAALRPFGALNALAQSDDRLQGAGLRVSVRRQRCEQYADSVRHGGVCQLLRRFAGRWRCRRAQLLPAWRRLPNFALNPNLPDIATLFNSKATRRSWRTWARWSQPTTQGAVSGRDDGCRRICSRIPTSNWSGRTQRRAGRRRRAGLAGSRTR